METMEIKELLKNKRVQNWLKEFSQTIEKRDFKLEFFHIDWKTGFTFIKK